MQIEEINLKKKSSDLSAELGKKYSSDLKNWQIFNYLQSEFVSQIHMVLVYGGGVAALIVTKDKKVYAFGNNQGGQLGIGDIALVLYPKTLEILCGKNIKTFVCDNSENICFAVTKEGKVYSWGYKTKEFNGEYKIVNKPTLMEHVILSKEHIIDVACGRDYFLALLDDGKVYIAWNSAEISHSWQNGGGRKHEFSGKKVVSIACGSSFCIAVTNNGEVYGWNVSNSNQLERNSIADLHPCKIAFSEDTIIVKVVCGLDHFLALTNKGKIYVWGDNDSEQLGTNENDIFDEPIMLNDPAMGTVLDIAAINCENLSVAVNADGCIYTWGTYIDTITTPFATTFANIHDVFAFKGTMHKPLILSAGIMEYVDNRPDILKYLEAAFDDSLTSDLRIQIKEQSIYVHKAILKICSSHFRTVFQHFGNDESVIKYDQFSYIAYKAYFKYLYTGIVDISPMEALELLELAQLYQETNLEKDCIQTIQKGIIISNVLLCYSKAIQCNVKELEEFCFFFAMGHTKAVMLSEHFLKLEEHIKNDFIIRLAKTDAFRS